MPLRAHMHTHEIFHHYEPYDLDKCPPHEFLGMYSWPNKHIALLLYQVWTTVTTLEEENLGNNDPIFWKTPHKHLYSWSDLHTKDA